MTRDDVLAYIKEHLEFHLYGVEVNADGNIGAWDARAEVEIEIVIHPVLDEAAVESALDLYERRMAEPPTAEGERYPCGLLVWVVTERAVDGMEAWVKQHDDLHLVWTKDLTIQSEVEPKQAMTTIEQLLDATRQIEELLKADGWMSPYEHVRLTLTTAGSCSVMYPPENAPDTLRELGGSWVPGGELAALEAIHQKLLEQIRL